MQILAFITGAISVIVIAISLKHILKGISRKSKSKNWKVGDKIILENYLTENQGILDQMNKENKKYANLLGWNKENVYLGCGSLVYKLPWESISSNKSALWRSSFEECKKFMKGDPGFDGGVSEEKNKDSGPFLSIDGQPIETMNETLCKIHLGKALKEEKYEIAEALRKRLENFR
jgi:hypothetical protein